MDADVVIIGGGPAGLTAALRLHSLGVRPLVLERRTSASIHSRAIGIHPPSLELMENLGVAADLVDAGHRVRGGRAVGAGGALGRLDFKALPPPFRFALSLPQGSTEAILQAHLEQRVPGALVKGKEVIAYEEDEDQVQVGLASGETLRAPFGLACDGKGSLVRDSLAIPFTGGSYDDAFVMGDYAETGEVGDEAVVFLVDQGLVESFPLPASQRRWVCWVPAFLPDPTPETVADIVLRRAGVDLHGSQCTMVSPFGVQHYLADRFHGQRTLLAGDSAHVVSPIGGQGMNLGFMDAWDAGAVLAEMTQGVDPASRFASYSRRRRRVARRGAARAAFFMALGVGGWWNPLRNTLIRFLLRSPIHGTLARAFTMQNLGPRRP